MGRVIKLFIYYLLYTFAFSGIFAGGYMIANHTLEFPQSDPEVFQLTMWAQLLIAFHHGGRCPFVGLEICKT